MSKFKKKLLGFLTAWPFGYFVLFFLAIFGLIATQPGDIGPIGGLTVLFVMLLHFLTIFLIIGLQIFYLVHMIKSEEITKEQKIVWAIALFFGGFIAMPIYWYLNIWKGPSDEDNMYRGLPPGDAFQSANANQWERTGDPVPPEPHSWK